MSKIGILTYHSAYNYGSALQALATQEVVGYFAAQPEIINYRMRSQKNIYTLYRTKFGVKNLVKDLLQLPVHKQRKERAERFENFFAKYFSLSEECETPEQVYALWNRYNTIVSGSDQIWNKHSLELESCEWEYMYPYLLRDYPGRKVSYASSISNMTDEELQIIKTHVDDFDAVSIREISSTKRMADMLDVPVNNVLDPTFLLTKEEWIAKLDLHIQNNQKYILYYSLGGINYIRRNRPILRALAEKHGCKIKVIMPFANVQKDSLIIPCPSFGPIEFLTAIANAQMVVTDSFHGTILSVNFGKDLYSLCKKGGSTFRKTDIMSLLGMGERAVFNPENLLNKHFSPIDYVEVNAKLAIMRKKAWITCILH